MDVVIRMAMPRDAIFLESMLGGVMTYGEGLEGQVDKSDESLWITEEYIEQNIVFIAQKRETIIGCCALRKTQEVKVANGIASEPEYWLEHLFVRSAYVGQGIGTKLMEEIIAYCKANGISTFSVISNPNTDGFYKKMGATYVEKSNFSESNKNVSLLNNATLDQKLLELDKDAEDDEWDEEEEWDEDEFYDDEELNTDEEYEEVGEGEDEDYEIEAENYEDQGELYEIDEIEAEDYEDQGELYEIDEMEAEGYEDQGETYEMDEIDEIEADYEDQGELYGKDEIEEDYKDQDELYEMDEIDKEIDEIEEDKVQEEDRIHEIEQSRIENKEDEVIDEDELHTELELKEKLKSRLSYDDFVSEAVPIGYKFECEELASTVQLDDRVAEAQFKYTDEDMEEEIEQEDEEMSSEQEVLEEMLKIEKEKILAGEMHIPWGDAITKDRQRARRLLQEFNNADPEDRGLTYSILKQLFGRVGEFIYIEPYFNCRYGYNIEIGENLYVGYNCVILDHGHVSIGDNCIISSQVGIYTLAYPLETQRRIEGYEYTKSVVIGNNVWIGQGAIINPGVTIGNDVVIAPGTVVNKDIPDGAVASGNPVKIINKTKA